MAKASKPVEQAKTDKAKTNGAAAPANDTSPSADAIVKAHRFDKSNLIGNLGDTILATMKAARGLKPWEKMTETEQRDLIAGAKDQAKAMVAGVLNAIAARGLQKMHAELADGATIKGGMVILKCGVVASAENFDLLLSGRTKVMVVFADAAQFDGAMAATPEADQRKLALAGGKGDKPLPPHDPDTGEIKDDDETDGEPISASTAAAAARGPEAPAETSAG